MLQHKIRRFAFYLYAIIGLFATFGTLSASTIIVPEQYDQLINAIWAARCNDTIVCRYVADWEPIKFNNKTLHFRGSSYTTSMVRIDVPFIMTESHCTFDSLEIHGSNAPTDQAGGPAISAKASELMFIDCRLIGGNGGKGTSCTYPAGGPGLYTDSSIITFRNVSSRSGAYGLMGGSFCIDRGPGKPIGAIMNSHSILDTMNFSIHDSLIFDLTSIAGSASTHIEQCYRNPLPTEPFSLATSLNWGGSPGLLVVGDFNNDDLIDVMHLYNSPGNMWYGCYMNKGDYNFIPGGYFSSSAVGQSAQLGDYNGDGYLDLAIGYSIAGNNNAPGAWLKYMFSATPCFLDVDNDGDLDLVVSGDTTADLQKWQTKLYINNKGVFTEVPSGIAGTDIGRMAAADYDNDGDKDLVIVGRDVWTGTDRTKIYRNDNGQFYPIIDTIHGYYRDLPLWGDYDNDGDLDLRIGNKLYRNDNGHFILTTVSLPAASAAWGDYDNDGDIDLFCQGVYRNDRDSFPRIEQIDNIYRSVGQAWADIDNDGRLDVVAMGEQKIQVFLNNTRNTNTPPTTPTGLRSEWSSNRMLLSWARAFDQQTPPLSLSYSVRVGTVPGGRDIMSPASNIVNGYVRIPAMGNVDLDTAWPLRNLPPGRYYWSVQTIDNGYLGSPFAPEQTFDISATAVSSSTQRSNQGQPFITTHSLGGTRTVTISFTQALAAHSRIEIFAIDGRQIAKLSAVVPETHQLALDVPLRCGQYIYKITVYEKGTINPIHIWQGKLMIPG